MYQINAYIRHGRKRGNITQTTGDVSKARAFWNECLARTDCVSIYWIGPKGEGATAIRRPSGWSLHSSGAVLEVTP